MIFITRNCCPLMIIDSGQTVNYCNSLAASQAFSLEVHVVEHMGPLYQGKRDDSLSWSSCHMCPHLVHFDLLWEKPGTAHARLADWYQLWYIIIYTYMGSNPNLFKSQVFLNNSPTPILSDNGQTWVRISRDLKNSCKDSKTWPSSNRQPASLLNTTTTRW